MAAWGEKATLSVPLVYGDEVFGVLDVGRVALPAALHRRRDPPGRGDRHAGGARHPQRPRRSTRPQRRNADLATLLGVAATLSSTVDAARVLAAIARHLREALGSASAEVYQLRPARPLDEARGLRHRHAAERRRRLVGVYELNEDPLLAAASTSAAWWSRRRRDRPGADPRRPGAWGDASELWVPLVYQDEVPRPAVELRGRTRPQYSAGRDRPGDRHRRRRRRPPAERARLRASRTGARRAGAPERAPVGVRRAVRPDARPALRGALDRPARPRAARDPRVQPVGDLPLRLRRPTLQRGQGVRRHARDRRALRLDADPGPASWTG